MNKKRDKYLAKKYLNEFLEKNGEKILDEDFISGVKGLAKGAYDLALNAGDKINRYIDQRRIMAASRPAPNNQPQPVPPQNPQQNNGGFLKSAANFVTSQIANPNVRAGLGAAVGLGTTAASWYASRKRMQELLKSCRGNPECEREVRSMMTSSTLKHAATGALAAGIGAYGGYNYPQIKNQAVSAFNKISHVGGKTGEGTAP